MMKRILTIKIGKRCNTPACPEYKKDKSLVSGPFCEECEIPMEDINTFIFPTWLLYIFIGLIFIALFKIIGWSLSNELSKSFKAYVPAGEYTVSSNLRHYLKLLGRDSIRIDTPFSIQRGEVTVEEFRKYVESLDEESRKQLETSWEKDRDGNPYPDNKPVENISWDVASDYAQWLGEKTGWDLRLPTLEQWAVAVILYPESRPVLKTEDAQPMAGLRNQPDRPDHLIGNLREWSSDICQDGRYRILGENYMTDEDAVGMDNCAKGEWKGVGFRLVRIGE